MDSPTLAAHPFMYPPECERRIEKDTFRCPTCSAELDDRQDMIDHMKSHVAQAESPCRRPVPTPQESEKEPTIEPPLENRTTCFRCRVCQAEHETKEEAFRHMEEHQAHDIDDADRKKHVVRRMAFKCQKCGEELKSQDEFLDHMVDNHNAHPQMYGSRKVYCPDVAHTQQETTVVTFGCSMCSEQFTSKDAMMAHLETNHKQANPLTFRCSECQKAFNSKDEVLLHMNEVHPKITQVESNCGPIMSCPICKLGVTSREEMATHLRTHDSVNESFADTIEKEIFESPNGDDNSVFRCSECGVQMASKLEVVRHMSEAHGKHRRGSSTNGEEEGGKIVRQTDPTTGRAQTVVEKADGKTYIFDDAEAVKYVKMDDDAKKAYTADLCMLGMRGLVTELGQRLIDESRLFKQRKQERELLVGESAYKFFGLTVGAKKKDVQDAYKLKARQLHPDKNGGTEEAKAKFQRMKAMHEILKRNFADDDDMAEPLSPTAQPADPATPTPAEPVPLRPKEAYDEEEPVKRDDAQKTLSYDPRNRSSMEKALDKMSSEITNAWKNIKVMSTEIDTLAAELGLKR